MSFDIQDAMELAESAKGEECRFTLQDGTELTARILAYDHHTDRIETGFGYIRRARVSNVVVLDRMDTIIETCVRKGLVV